MAYEDEDKQTVAALEEIKAVLRKYDLWAAMQEKLVKPKDVPNDLWGTCDDDMRRWIIDEYTPGRLKVRRRRLAAPAQEQAADPRRGEGMQ